MSEWEDFFNCNGSKYISLHRDRFLCDDFPTQGIQVEELYQAFASRYAAERQNSPGSFPYDKHEEIRND